MTHHRWISLTLVTLAAAALGAQEPAASSSLLETQRITPAEVWVMPPRQQRRPGDIRVTAWFDEQLLGDGQAYKRRSQEWADRRRRELRTAAIATLKHLSSQTHARAAASLQKLIDRELIFDLRRHWIINGFTCNVRTEAAVEALKEVPGVARIFRSRSRWPIRREPPAKPRQAVPGASVSAEFDPTHYRYPWYIRHLLVDRVWREFGVTGSGTLNVIHDGNFVLRGDIVANLYRNPREIADNGKDDDGNGLIDDVYGYNFATGSAQTTVQPGNSNLHGNMCAQIICGRGISRGSIGLGLAPESQWAGVVAGLHLEVAVEWAIEQGADTYSMSFSRPGLGNYRSHWRKLMEHGAFCGVHFVSGAGNFARDQPIPVQMRIPEDIPHAVFAAAGVQRDLSRTPFSSQGPVEWKTEHYREGQVNKPEVCAFNLRVPLLPPSGGKPTTTCSGNSFAGPMFCGTIALMLSANPELKPWETRQIIIRTATDVADKGFDSQTGHGLINAFEAVKQARERK